MRIVVISDSHGNKLGIDKIFQSMKFDGLLFLGDGLGDIGDYKYLDNVYVVSGNCDFFSDEPNERFIELSGKKIFMTHGNRYGVKLGLGSITRKGVEMGADVVLFGHTHNRFIEKIGDIYLINPGKFGRGVDGKSSGLILNIDGEKIDIEEFSV